MAALPGQRLFNRVVGLQSVDEEVLEAADRFFGDTQYFISLAPQAGGEELLHQGGFEEDYRG